VYYTSHKGGGSLEAKTSADLLRGHTDTVVLSILMKGDNYGYEIHKSILERLGGEYELKEATLYSSYKRLEAEGFVSSYWGDETQGGRRKYYRITEAGKELFRQNKADWAKTQAILNRLLEG
jgi:DNA-binding PadR family transcriptional regulator